MNNNLANSEKTISNKNSLYSGETDEQIILPFIISTNYDIKNNSKNFIYYEKMINNIKENKDDLNILINNIITSFTPYYISNHYIGNEISEYKLPKTLSNNLLNNLNYNEINEFDIIFCQVNFFNYFFNIILPNIKCKIILITGQWQLPMLNKNNNTDILLNDERIHKWYSQNPIYTNNKYYAFPYGINYGYDQNNPSLKTYAHFLLNSKNYEKKENIINLPMNYNTNICRNVFEKLNYIDYETYCNKLIISKFILSPIGDRNDCYRHWEAIGFGVVPICNINNEYKSLFNENMIYVNNTNEMLDLLNNNINLEYVLPNKNLITV